MKSPSHNSKRNIPFQPTNLATDIVLVNTYLVDHVILQASLDVVIIDVVFF
jgi:hypothetical protein